MRIVMWFGIGFAAACALGAYTLPITWLIPAAAFLAAALCSALGVRWKHLLVWGVLLLGAAAGSAWFLAFDSIYLAPARDMDGQTLKTQITATGYIEETSYGYAVEGRITLQEHGYKVRLYLKEADPVSPGDILRGSFRVSYNAPKEGQRTSYYQGEGIFLSARQQDDLARISTDTKDLRQLPPVLARRIQTLLQDIFPEDVFPFVQALLLGEDSELAYRQNMDLKLAGIRHIIAVSGLHVSILYSVVAKFTFRRRFLTLLAGIPVLLLFAGAAGFTPSVNRACMMTALMMLSDAFRKEYDGPTALSFACTLMLVFNPMVITSVSFQLSALCVAGILLFQKPIQTRILCVLWGSRKHCPKLLKSLVSSVAMTLSAMVLTTPLTALYFGSVSLIGILANLLTLWIVNLIFVGIILACLASLVSTALGSMLGWLLAWPIRFVLWAASCLSKAPLAAVYTASPYIVVWLVMCYGMLLAVRMDQRLLGRKGGCRSALCIGCIGLCLALGLSWLEPLKDDYRVTVLNVGQGQAILLQAEGKTFLVDCGGSSDETAADTVGRHLYSQGIRRLDGLILTHTDADHAGGAAYLTAWVKIPLLLLPATSGDYNPPEAIDEVIWVDRELEIAFGQARIRIFPPVYSPEKNENSLAILFERGDTRTLITGDRSDWGERMLLKNHEIPQVDLLIAGHHGSSKSTGEALLEAAQPEAVIVSVGRHNVYGHPGPEFLIRVEEYGCAVYRTDVQGTIIFRSRNPEKSLDRSVY